MAEGTPWSVKLQTILVVGAVVLVGGSLVVVLYRQSRSLPPEDEDPGRPRALARKLMWFHPPDSRRMESSTSGEHRIVVMRSPHSIGIDSEEMIAELVEKFRSILQENVDLVLYAHLTSGTPMGGSGPRLSERAPGFGANHFSIGGGWGNPDEAMISLHAVYDRGRARGAVVLQIYGEPAMTTLALVEFPR
jgi:hypothetical protein